MIVAHPIRWKRPPLVVVDLGHTGATGGDAPATHKQLSEDMLVLAYGTAIVRVLRLTGVDATFSGPGNYRLRQERARALGADAYLAPHANSGAAKIEAAGNPRRHLLFTDYRATKAGGVGLANHIIPRCAELDIAPGVWRRRAADPDDWTRGAYGLLRHLGPVPGVVLEPGFIDDPAHLGLWSPAGLCRLGEQIALGTIDYLLSRGLAHD